jgi:hypothetical protein
MNPRGAYTKKSRNVENVQARHEWCLARLYDPNELSEGLIAALTNQRSFAALHVPGSGVHPIALNTLKAIADEILSRHAPDGKGFLYLDGLRQALKEKATQRTDAGGPRRRHDQSIDELRKRLRFTEVSNLERAQAYVDLFSKVLALSKATYLDDAMRLRLHNLLEDHRDLYAPLLSPTLTQDHSVAPLRAIRGGKA